MASIKVTVEYRFETGDSIIASLIADILGENMKNKKGTMLSDNYGIFDFNPSEEIKAVIVDA